MHVSCSDLQFCLVFFDPVDCSHLKQDGLTSEKVGLVGVAWPERGWLHSDTMQIPVPSFQAQFDEHLFPLTSSAAYIDCNK